MFFCLVINHSAAQSLYDAIFRVLKDGPCYTVKQNIFVEPNFTFFRQNHEDTRVVPVNCGLLL